MFKKFVNTTRNWKKRHDMRHELAMLDERSLRDMGIDRYLASREARKPFWRA